MIAMIGISAILSPVQEGKEYDTCMSLKPAAASQEKL